MQDGSQHRGWKKVHMLRLRGKKIKILQYKNTKITEVAEDKH